MYIKGGWGIEWIDMGCNRNMRIMRPVEGSSGKNYYVPRDMVCHYPDKPIECNDHCMVWRQSNYRIYRVVSIREYNNVALVTTGEFEQYRRADIFDIVRVTPPDLNTLTWENNEADISSLLVANDGQYKAVRTDVGTSVFCQDGNESMCIDKIPYNSRCDALEGWIAMFNLIHEDEYA